MTTPIERAKREEVTEQASAARLTTAALARASASSAARVAINNAAGKPLPGSNPMDFVRDHRIHIKDGSLFIDPYLAIHPRELAPKNEAKLREKLTLTYSVNNPSFYESYDRFAVAINLAQLIPVSLAAKRGRLMEEVHKFNAQIDSGADAQLQKVTQDRTHPFAAILRDTIEKPKRDPEGIETLKNGVAMYLLVREKLTQQKFLNPLSSYVSHARTPDQVLGDLESKIGVTPLQMRQAALKGGLEGVGRLLGLDLAYVAEVKAFTEHAATQEFSHNLIEHWHLGRQKLGIAAPMAQKIATGMAVRIDGKIAEFRAQVKHFYDVPSAIHAEEKRVAEALNLVEPIQRALLHKLGYEICYTPDYFADGIAKYSNIYGLHRKAANDLRDIKGTYRIYFSGRGDLKGSMRTLVHEIAHNLWPEQFSAEDVTKIDALAASDAQRFAALHRLMSEKFSEFETFLRAYQAGSDAEKAAIVQTTKAYFASYGVSIDEGVLPYLRDANELRYLAAYAVDTLTVEGARYAKSGYTSPQERFREVLSRFAEIKQVELSGNPQLTQFLAPGLNQIWETQYIPHLKRVCGRIDAMARPSANTGKDMAEVTHVSEMPKVAERPGTPIKPANADACAVDHGAPDTQVATDSAHLDGLLNERTIGAINTLGAMHVHPGR